MNGVDGLPGYMITNGIAWDAMGTKSTTHVTNDRGLQQPDTGIEYDIKDTHGVWEWTLDSLLGRGMLLRA